MQNIFQNVREYLTPVLADSSFLTKGLLTPEEFVAAGDQLCYKCPTWRWESGEEQNRKIYLPPNKQYLVTTNVPCRKRVGMLENEYQEEKEATDEPEWMETQVQSAESPTGHCAQDIGHISSFAESGNSDTQMNILSGLVDEHFSLGNTSSPRTATIANDPIPDMNSFEEEDNIVEDSGALAPTNRNGQTEEITYLTASEPVDDSNIVLTRTYDLSISYDKYYQTPRVWLFGYNENGQPLSSEEVFQDIMQDYANRTVTIEPHPHTDWPQASIHPCQHGAVMKRIVSNLLQGGKEIRSDQYMFIFLKFIQSVIPTIDYDYTIEVEADLS